MTQQNREKAIDNFRNKIGRLYTNLTIYDYGDYLHMTYKYGDKWFSCDVDEHHVFNMY